MTTTSSLEQAQQRLLAPTALDIDSLQRTFSELMGPGIDAGDLYFQHSRHESWGLEDGIVKDASHTIEQGVGIRAISGDRSGFSYTDELLPEALLQCARAARAIAANGARHQAMALGPMRSGKPLYPAIDPIDLLAAEEKVALLQRIDAHARRQDPCVSQVMVSLSGVSETILVAASDGTLAADVRPLVRVNVSVIAERGGRREQGYAGGGGRYDYAELLQGGLAERLAEDAVRQALVNLDAIDAPAGSMVVVLGPGWPGVLLHEAIGHGLEGDFNRKGTSVFSGRLGQKVASSLCTIVDDGTLSGRRGSLSIDDEGTATQCTTLIDKGVLSCFMQDKLNARLSSVAATGNGRRESFAHLPMPRMTNTYMRAGDSDPAEILASVERGLYAVNFGGGQVDITSGKFVFSASEAYLIENGKVTRPVRGATLIGAGHEVLQRVSMVGNDLQLDAGVGVCGKEGQSVPVGVGQPTLRVDGLTVGGTA